jgi:hypothetical protein
MTLQWTKDEAAEGGLPEQYIAESGDRSYIIRIFHPAAHDRDPLLVMHDDVSQCWSLRTWVGNHTRGPLRLFDSLNAALFAAQDEEDGQDG